ncbi:rhodanese-like domain-containing protein [Dyadobacter sp.]|uniref:rhodanese-like domain-containing protein n=1 Tax=Dyadobacter sp. TaxID=1914288 RepID=UPI003F715729
MKKIKQMITVLSLLISFTYVQAQITQEPWSASQLMPPKKLADRIQQAQAPMPLIVNIGPQAVIKGSVDVGPAGEKPNIKKLETFLSKEDKNREVVLYCGCCPFDRCPNIRPAFTQIKKMGFKKAKLLDIPKNIKTDWIDKDYPVQ